MQVDDRSQAKASKKFNYAFIRPTFGKCCISSKIQKSCKLFENKNVRKLDTMHIRRFGTFQNASKLLIWNFLIERLKIFETSPFIKD